MLSHKQAKAFYDRFGRKQDWQGFYEDKPIQALLRHGAFDEATALFEFGCGTGRFAEMILDSHLPAGAKYVGVDISETMVTLAQNRLARFGTQAEVYLTSGSPQLDFASGTFNRFISNYVLDLLTSEDIRRLLQEAQRMLSCGGLLGLVSLTHGFTPLSRVVEHAWMAAHAIRPALVGGCRPIELLEFVATPAWRLHYRDRYTSYGVPSELLVAEKVAI